MGVQEIHFSFLCLIKTFCVYWITVIRFSLFSISNVALLCKFLNFVRKTLFIFSPIFFERDWQWKLSFDIQDPKSEAYSLTYELSGGLLSYPTRGLTWIKKPSFNCCVCLLFFELLVCERRSFWFSHSSSSNSKLNTIDISIEELFQYRTAVC